MKFLAVVLIYLGVLFNNHLLDVVEASLLEISKISFDGNCATFSFIVTEDSLVAIKHVVSKREEVLWGVAYVNSGSYDILVTDKNLSASSSGFIEVCKISYEHFNTIGKRGSGELQFNSPQGFVYDKINDEFYVADTGNDRIVRISKDGRQIAQYGGFGVANYGKVANSEVTEDNLSSPWDVAINNYSSLYVSDYNNDRVCLFDNYRKFRGVFFPSERSNKFRSFKRPKGVFVDNENNIWVIDSKNDKILKISTAGNVIFEIGGYGLGKWNLSKPSQLYIDNLGHIYVADTNKGRIIIFNKFGKLIKEIKDGIYQPISITLDSAGLIYVGDQKLKNVIVFDKNGKMVGFVEGSNKNASNQNERFIKNPVDLQVINDYLYILDCENCSIEVFKVDKNIHKLSWQLR